MKESGMFGIFNRFESMEVIVFKDNIYIRMDCIVEVYSTTKSKKLLKLMFAYDDNVALETIASGYIQMRNWVIIVMSRIHLYNLL